MNREYRRVSPNGKPILNATFDQIPELDDRWTFEQRTVGEWESSEPSDYAQIFGREPEPWRIPLGALRLTLAGEPVDVERARDECEELVRILNESD